MTEIGGGIAVAKAVADVIKGAKSGGWLDNLLVALRKKPKVLVLGCTGVGKTLFLKSLEADVISKAVEELRQTKTVDEHSIKISNKLFNFTDGPGEGLKSVVRDEAIRQAAGEKVGTLGIINVVAYGYHEREVGKPEFKRGKLIDKEFLETYVSPILR